MASLLQSRALGVATVQRTYVIDYTELDAASTTQSVSLTTLPAGAIGMACWIDVTTAFTDAGSISALGIEVGDSADPNALVSSVDGFAVSGRSQNIAAGSTEVWGGMAVEVKVTATGANLGDGAGTTSLDGGQVLINLLYMVID